MPFLNICVRILVFLAERTGMTYKEINVWIFVILWPLLTIALIAVIFLQHRRIKSLTSLYGNAQDKNRSDQY